MEYQQRFWAKYGTENENEVTEEYNQKDRDKELLEKIRESKFTDKQ